MKKRKKEKKKKRKKEKNICKINKNNVLQYQHGSTSDKLTYKNECHHD